MNKITLVHGKGNGTTTACVVSLAAKKAGYPFQDNFPCLCPVVRALTIPLNDIQWWVDDAERTRKLRPLSRLLPGTKSTRAVEIKRAHLCALWAARVFAASALESAGRRDLAARLRELPDHSSLADLRFHAAANAANAASACVYAKVATTAAANAANAAVNAAATTATTAAAITAAHAANAAATTATTAAHAAITAITAAHAANAAAHAANAACAYAKVAAANAAEAAANAANAAEAAANAANAACAYAKVAAAETDAKKHMRRELKNLILAVIAIKE